VVEMWLVYLDNPFTLPDSCGTIKL